MDGVTHKQALDKIRKAIRRKAKTKDPTVERLIDAVVAPLIHGFHVGLYDDAIDAAELCGTSIREAFSDEA